MKEWTSQVKVIGLDDLTESLQAIIKKYPDRAGECLREEARRTRKDIVKNARELTETNTKSKMSLGRIGTYKISQVQGYGVNQYVEIGARAPHYHLVERGHAMVLPYHFTWKNKKTGQEISRTWKNGGQTRGRVSGRFFLKKAKDAEKERFPIFVDEMVDKIIRDVGL